MAMQLRQGGLPNDAVLIRTVTPAHGLNLGSGVSVDAVAAIVEQHTDEANLPGEEAGYVVEAYTDDSPSQNELAMKVLGIDA